MTVLTIPSAPKPAEVRFGLQSNTQAFVSPLSGATQTLEMPGARWFGRWKLPPMDEAETGPWKSFLLKLRGQAGRFYGFDHIHVRRGAGGGTPLVKGAGATGTTLPTDGWPFSTTVLKEGDYFAFDTPDGKRELKMAVTDAVTNGAGEVSITFEPPIRTSPADNAAIILADPSAIMMLRDPSIAWDNESVRLYGIEFEAIEALT